MLKQVANRERVSIEIELDDFKKYDKGEEVINDLEKNTLRYVSVFSNAIDQIMPLKDSDANIEEDSIDVLADWRYLYLIHA